MTQSSGSSGKRREFLDLLLSWERAFGNHHGGVTFRYTQDSEKRTVDIGTDIKNGVSKRNQGLAGRFTYNWNYRKFCTRKSIRFLSGFFSCMERCRRVIC